MSWDACEQAAATLDYAALNAHLESRETAKAEDIMRHAVMNACDIFYQMYES